MRIKFNRHFLDCTIEGNCKFTHPCPGAASSAQHLSTNDNLHDHTLQLKAGILSKANHAAMRCDWRGCAASRVVNDALRKSTRRPWRSGGCVLLHGLCGRAALCFTASATCTGQREYCSPLQRLPATLRTINLGGSSPVASPIWVCHASVLWRICVQRRLRVCRPAVARHLRRLCSTRGKEEHLSASRCAILAASLLHPR